MNNGTGWRYKTMSGVLACLLHAPLLTSDRRGLCSHHLGNEIKEITGSCQTSCDTSQCFLQLVPLIVTGESLTLKWQYMFNRTFYNKILDFTFLSWSFLPVPSCASFLTPPASSIAVKYGPCLLTLKTGSRLSKPRDLGNFTITWTSWNTGQVTGCWASSFWVHRRLMATIKRSKLAWLRPWQPQIHPSGQYGGRPMPQSAVKMLNWQHQRVDISAMSKLLTRASSRQDWNRISAESSVVLLPPSDPNDQSVKGLTWAFTCWRQDSHVLRRLFPSVNRICNFFF